MKRLERGTHSSKHPALLCCQQPFDRSCLHCCGFGPACTWSLIRWCSLWDEVHPSAKCQHCTCYSHLPSALFWSSEMEFCSSSAGTELLLSRNGCEGASCSCAECSHKAQVTQKPLTLRGLSDKQQTVKSHSSCRRQDRADKNLWLKLTQLLLCSFQILYIHTQGYLKTQTFKLRFSSLFALLLRCFLGALLMPTFWSLIWERNIFTGCRKIKNRALQPVAML